jgi:hypothetical protein
MNKSKQLWSLLKFQSTANPFIWFLPFAFAFPLLFSHTLPDSYHPNLSSLLTAQNIFFVGIFGSMIIAPERFQLGAANAANPGSEFVLTRAIDRPIFYRSKAVFLYGLVMSMPLVSLLYALDKPDLKVTEYSAAARMECIASVPGSTLEKDPSGSTSPLIVIPRGNVLVEEWHFWSYLVAVLGTQVLILLLYPFKYRILFFYTIFMGSIFGPLLWSLYGLTHSINAKGPVPESLGEGPFFFFAAHQVLFWIFAALAVIAIQIWCEWRFVRLEQ